ncbi:MAG: GFA family protein [Paracoccus sp. (in: a-proteobacteria)]|uniref:GFA family protein n=1 Tax=Paracoccus sp. TaxID=267 RepID=UPI0026E0DCB2|nr:GFA family protein [Paracoccus sp. (in: a-proteobacteria)]MDO5612630.1 GFA family protein [Paracoccus sp. (in: a-proteobacteria)]
MPPLVGASFDSDSPTVRGELRWFLLPRAAGRGFCPACGSSLFWRCFGADRVKVAAGAVDSPIGLRLAGHIHTADMGDYYTIDGGLPQAAQGG